MSAGIAKNEVTASKRRAFFVALAPDGYTPLWRGASFVGRGFVGKSTATLTSALGSFTNCRKPIVVADKTFTADNTTERFTANDHGLETGDGPFQVSNSGGALPSGLVAATDYWIIKINSNVFQLAASLANAYLGTAVAITTDGTGTQTIADTASTERGLDAEFFYEFSQAETNVDGSELLVIGDDIRRVFTANAGTDEISLTAHELRTGQPIIVSTDNGTLPAELVASTLYWVIRVSADAFKLATTQANAFAGTAINLTTAGSGVLYVEPALSRTRTSAYFSNSIADIWNYVLENGRTAGDLVRLTVRSLVARFSKTGNDYVIRDLANTKDSHSSTVTTAGKTASTIIDPT